MNYGSSQERIPIVKTEDRHTVGHDLFRPIIENRIHLYVIDAHHIGLRSRSPHGKHVPVLSHLIHGRKPTDKVSQTETSLTEHQHQSVAHDFGPTQAMRSSMFLNTGTPRSSIPLVTVGLNRGLGA